MMAVFLHPENDLWQTIESLVHGEGAEKSSSHMRAAGFLPVIDKVVDQRVVDGSVYSTLLMPHIERIVGRIDAQVTWL